jgi:hypothetical protein
VVARHFVAGIEIDTTIGFCVRAAPILYHVAHGRSVNLAAQGVQAPRLEGVDLFRSVTTVNISATPAE